MAPESLLFTPSNIGPLTLRSRTIRTADFEGMCIDNGPSEALYQYHTSVAAGEIGMTTATYAAVNRSGLSFPTQLWMRPGIIPGFFPYPPDTFNRFERYACSKLVFTLCSLRMAYLVNPYKTRIFQHSGEQAVAIAIFPFF